MIKLNPVISDKKNEPPLGSQSPKMDTIWFVESYLRTGMGSARIVPTEVEGSGSSGPEICSLFVC